MNKRRTCVKAKCTLLSSVIVFLIIYNGDYIKFVIARAWYDWVTSYSNFPVIEVNVIRFDSKHGEETKDTLLPRGYLG